MANVIKPSADLDLSISDRLDGENINGDEAFVVTGRRGVGRSKKRKKRVRPKRSGKSGSGFVV